MQPWLEATADATSFQLTIQGQVGDEEKVDCTTAHSEMTLKSSVTRSVQLAKRSILQSQGFSAWASPSSHHQVGPQHFGPDG